MKSIKSLLIKTHKAGAALRNATDTQIKKLPMTQKLTGWC
jgi:hypothetical protein